MIVYKSLYALGIYYNEKGLLETSWTDESSNLELSTVKNELIQILGTIREYKPGYILADTCKFRLEVDQDFQNWVALKFISEIIELKASKYAILVTPETFNIVSNELMADYPDEEFEIQYFINRDQALNWMGIQ